jgi:hypothetical protein
MSILAHDWLGAFHLYAGFLSPLQGLLVEACDPGAAARLQRALPRAIPFRPCGAPDRCDGMVCGLTESRIVDVLAGS